MMKMKKLLLFMDLLALVICLCGCESLLAEQVQPTATAEMEKTLGDFHVKILNAERTTDQLDADCIRVYVEFTNNSAEAVTFSETIFMYAYQNELMLDSPFILSGDNAVVDAYNFREKVEPGSSIQLARAFRCNYDFDVEVEISGFDWRRDGVLTKTFTK